MEYKDIKKNVWAFLENQVDFQDDGGLKMEFAQKDNEIDCIDCFYEQNEKNQRICSITLAVSVPDRFRTYNGKNRDFFGVVRTRPLKKIVEGELLKAQLCFEINFESNGDTTVKQKDWKRFVFHRLKSDKDIKVNEGSGTAHVSRWIVTDLIDIESESDIESMQQLPSEILQQCADIVNSLIKRLNEVGNELKEHCMDGKLLDDGEDLIKKSIENGLLNGVFNSDENMLNNKAREVYSELEHKDINEIDETFAELYMKTDKREEFCEMLLKKSTNNELKQYRELDKKSRRKMYDKWLTQKATWYRTNIDTVYKWAQTVGITSAVNFYENNDALALPSCAIAILEHIGFKDKDESVNYSWNNAIRRYLEWVYYYLSQTSNTDAVEYRERCQEYEKFLPRGKYSLNFFKETEEKRKTDIPYSRNRILFGAPGTGKSYVLKQQAEKYFQPENVERVTFHPEYSYFDFVGSYKPKMEGEGEAERIKYRFVPGPFIRILIEALAYPEQDYLLVIEEINRARVAAVFGDVFQLLDRNADGASEYGISPSEELKDHLTKALKEHSKIVDIDKLQIPANLYIWATMNSADQGVYPMDTAFKRRWNFEYQGIDEGREKVSGTHADAWHSLRENINMLLQEAGVNEDKQMGPFFMSPNELNCSAADFLAAFKNKVIMYLFEDAAKHKRDQVFRAKAQGKRYSEVCTLCGKDTLNAASILRDVFGVETANFTSEATQE